jgi:hypothetical protein
MSPHCFIQKHQSLYFQDISIVPSKRDQLGTGRHQETVFIAKCTWRRRFSFLFQKVKINDVLLISIPFHRVVLESAQN